MDIVISSDLESEVFGWVLRCFNIDCLFSGLTIFSDESVITYKVEPLCKKGKFFSPSSEFSSSFWHHQLSFTHTHKHTHTHTVQCIHTLPLSGSIFIID